MTPVPKTVPIALTVNGSQCRLDVLPHHTLLDMLRWQLDLTGTKECCAVGECGACTVLLDGRAVNACLVLSLEADGCEVATIEGLASDGRLSSIQDAFVAEGAVQCGFCIPGMVMAAQFLMQTNQDPTPAEVVEALAGNLCRCAGYSQIQKAVLTASQARRT
jgi:carbon-monoxide dehydrogenase small subunit